ncbi:MAG: hypothetical protein JSS98_19985 [Bacteroidetes bacterium]|nr:hypothetical protein [Bacteroidota bacterium]
MALSGINSSLKRIKNHYRLVVLNEDTFEEVVAFKMNRWSVYFMVSIFFVLLVGLTIALIAFTPLKFYLPGYNEAGNKTGEYEALKVRADSLEKTLILNQQYLNNIENVLRGNVISHDTAQLKIGKAPVDIAIPNKQKSKPRRRHGG